MRAGQYIRGQIEFYNRMAFDLRMKAAHLRAEANSCEKAADDAEAQRARWMADTKYDPAEPDQ